MLSMRILLAAIVVSVSVTAASAADLWAGTSADRTIYSSSIGQRSETLVVYDAQPGVVVRAYWQAPWRNRHYFPFTGHRPKIGRAENLAAPRHVSAAPETFRRYWSAESDMTPQQVYVIAPPAAPFPGALK
jgi:hypothetical protein